LSVTEVPVRRLSPMRLVLVKVSLVMEASRNLPVASADRLRQRSRGRPVPHRSMLWAWLRSSRRGLRGLWLGHRPGPDG